MECFYGTKAVKIRQFDSNLSAEITNVNELSNKYSNSLVLHSVHQLHMFYNFRGVYLIQTSHKRQFFTLEPLHLFHPLFKLHSSQHIYNSAFGQLTIHAIHMLNTLNMFVKFIWLTQISCFAVLSSSQVF